MEEHFDYPYESGSGPRQVLDVYLPHGSDGRSPLIVFIHGGAWRSAEAKDDFRQDLMPALVHTTGLPAAAVEYRLAPADPHPAQALDAFAGLSRLASSELFDFEKAGPRWDRQNIIAVGHSAGTFIALSLTLKPSNADHPFCALPPNVRRAIRHVVCVDGIFDLPTLLEEYPTYDSFVGEAFGLDPDVLEQESPARWNLFADEDSPRRVLVLHSKADELLSTRQPDEFVKRFSALQRRHDGQALLEVDYDSLKGTHDGVLRTDVLPRKIASWLE
ncbi:hypothetical protein OIV83_006468, partial [Microbotryomycetes sp. JL201]